MSTRIPVTTRPAPREVVADPIHIRIEFEVSTGELQPGTVAAFLSFLRIWTVAELADLTDTAQVTTTYRGESETWETPTP